MNFVTNFRGFSLVSVLIAIGLTGVLGMILLNLFDRQTQQQKKMLVDSELTEVINHIQTIMSKKESCNSTFMGKKKGQLLYRLLLNMDLSNPSFAEVGEPFRGTKIYMTRLKVLTDEEVTSLGRPLEQGVVVIDAEFERPEKTLGGRVIRKQFDLRVVYGREEVITHPVNDTGVVSLCKTDYGPTSFIKNLSSGERANPEESGVYPRGSNFEGVCVIPDPAGTTYVDSTINHCLTAN